MRRPLVPDHLRVPADLVVCQTTPSRGLVASILPLRSVLPGWPVPDHFVAPVQQILLFLDPEQTVIALGSCCSVAGLCCRFQVPQAPLPLLLQALAEVLQVRVASDLKMSQICGSCTTMLLEPSHAVLDLSSNRHG